VRAIRTKLSEGWCLYPHSRRDRAVLIPPRNASRSGPVPPSEQPSLCPALPLFEAKAKRRIAEGDKRKDRAADDAAKAPNGNGRADAGDRAAVEAAEIAWLRAEGMDLREAMRAVAAGTTR